MMRWDKEHFFRRKYWVAQCTEQPECFLIFSASAFTSRNIPIIRNGVRPFSGPFEALQRHVKEIRTANESNPLAEILRAEENAESSVVRIEGFEGPVSVRVRRVAWGPANRAILDLDTQCFRHKVHIDIWGEVS
jgi:hypothetical protein